MVLAGCYAGDLPEGERAVQPLREFGSPPIDLFQPLPYPLLQSMFDETGPAGHSYYIKGDYVSDVSDELIATLIEQAAAMPGPHCEIHFGQMGGAIAPGGRERHRVLLPRRAVRAYRLAHWIEPHDEEAHWPGRRACARPSGRTRSGRTSTSSATRETSGSSSPTAARRSTTGWSR